MTKKTKTALVVGPLVLLLLIFGGASIYAKYGLSIIPARGVVFKGTITGENIDCLLPDGGGSLFIDNKLLVTDPGYVSYRGRVGEVDSKLWACNNFEYKKDKKTVGQLGLPLEGQPNGGEELIGVRVEVYAKKIDKDKYTLQGNDNFYVKVIE